LSALLELQEAFARTVRSGKSTGIEALVASGRIAAEGRLAVYRNHFLISLGDALATTFPVVRRLVGEACFRAVARRFVQELPPRSPCVAEYGSDFAEFLAQLPPTSDLAYIADVARLEWALISAAAADDVPAVSPEGLAATDPLRLAGARLTLHPSFILLASAFPIDLIWRANQTCGAPPIVDLAAGEARLLVHRCNGEVGWTALPPDAFIFVVALVHGLSIAQAMQTAVDRDGFDPAAVLALLLQNGLIVDYSLLPTEECLQ
jgi:hypothetical protein